MTNFFNKIQVEFRKTLTNFEKLLKGDIEIIEAENQDFCRCGEILPKVKDDETPFEFCSRFCKFWYRDLDAKKEKAENRAIAEKFRSNYRKLKEAEKKRQAKK